MTPQVNITAFVDKDINSFALRTVYHDCPGMYKNEYTTFLSRSELQNGIKKCVAEAKEHTFDFGVNYITL